MEKQEKMEGIYKDGTYHASNESWHVEDSPWKAEQIRRIIKKNGIKPTNIAEVGCGAGVILEELSKDPYLHNVRFRGYDISQQAISLCNQIGSAKVEFYQEDLFATNNLEFFDILLVIDVFEHVPDYLSFLDNCRRKAEHKIYHIPLDIHVSGVLRNTFYGGRYSLGHLHYFTADTAIASLKDTGHEIMDQFYTNAAFGLFFQHPSINRAIANVPRWLFSKLSISFTARVFGGYSLLVLAR